jgi:hypothetical protein
MSLVVYHIWHDRFFILPVKSETMREVDGRRVLAKSLGCGRGKAGRGYDYTTVAVLSYLI